MKYGQLINLIETRGDFDSTTHAEKATRATLAVLGQRLGGGEPRDLAQQLPTELQNEVVSGNGAAQAFGLDEFCRRVAEREGQGCSANTARTHAHAVLRTIAETVSTGEIEDVQTQLPPDFGDLLR